MVLIRPRFGFLFWNLLISITSGEQGMVDEAQKALEEAEALKKVCVFVLLFLVTC